MKVYVILICFSVALTVHAVEFAILKVGGFRPLQKTSGRMSYVIHAVPVLGRYLASTKFYPKDESEVRSWMQQYRGSRMFAPAWFSKDWGLVSTGEPMFGHDDSFEALPSDISVNEIETMRMTGFPQLVMRDATSDNCPYVYGLSIQLKCLNHELQTEATKEGNKRQWYMPSQARGYLGLDGNLWVKLLYDGHLLGQFDVNKGTFINKAISVSTLKEAFRTSGAKEAELTSLSTENQLVIEERAKEELSQRETADPNLQYKSKWLKTPGSFQFNVLIEGKRAYVVLRKPLAIVIVRWPEGKVVKVLSIGRDVLPNWAHDYSQLYIGSVGFHNSQFIAWFFTTRPLKYKNILETDPARAKRIAENWQDEERLMPDTVLGIDDRAFAISVQGDSISRVYSMETMSPDGEWGVGLMPVLIAPENMWIWGFNRKTNQFGVSPLT